MDPAILRQETDKLRNLARALLANPTDADDVVQESWLLWLRRRPGAAVLLARWLPGVLRNMVRGTHRARRRRDTHEARVATRTAPADPSHTSQHRELLHAVVEAVFELPEPYRQTLIERYLQETPVVEVARRMGISTETVKTRQKRGLARLRSRLDSRFGERRSWCGPLGGALGLPAHGLGEFARTPTLAGLSGSAALLAPLLIVLGNAGLAWHLTTPAKRAPATSTTSALSSALGSTTPTAATGPRVARTPALPSTVQQTTSDPGSVLDSEVRRPESPWQLHGSVRHQDEIPVVGAEVLLWVPEGLDQHVVARTTSDETGTFAVDIEQAVEALPAVLYRGCPVWLQISIGQQVRIELQAREDLQPDTEWRDLDVVLPSDRETVAAPTVEEGLTRLHGQVVTPDGAPAPYVKVWAEWLAPPADRPSSSQGLEDPKNEPSRLLEAVESDMRGRFQFTGLHKGTHRLMCGTRSAHAPDAVVHDTKDGPVRLVYRVHRLLVRAWDEGGRRLPVDLAVRYANGDGSAGGPIAVDQPHSVCVRTGHLTVHASMPGLRPAAQELEIGQHEWTRFVDLTLKSLREPNGGQGTGSVRVNVRPLGGGSPLQVQASFWTDTGSLVPGLYRMKLEPNALLEDVPTGSYLVKLMAGPFLAPTHFMFGGHFPESVPVEVREGEVADLEALVRPGCRIRFHFRFPEGRAPERLPTHHFTACRRGHQPKRMRAFFCRTVAGWTAGSPLGNTPSTTVDLYEPGSYSFELAIKGYAFCQVAALLEAGQVTDIEVPLVLE